MQKVQGCRAFGAEIVMHGMNIGESKALAETDARFANKLYINGYDHPQVIAGAGTMGLEIVEQLPDVDYVFVPTGGGGLLAGTSLAVKTLKSDCKVIGVESKVLRLSGMC